MNTPFRRDHSTRISLSEESVKEKANCARTVLDPSLRADFNIVDVLEYLTRNSVYKWGKLKIRIFPATEGEDLTFVELTEAGKTLHVDGELWDDAKIGEPKSRYMLAHELGHLVLHDCYVQPYSDEKKSIYGEGNSTEWQAHAFARHFLLHDNHLKVGLTPLQIAMSCSVDVSHVRKRLGPRVRSSDELCICGSEKVFFVDDIKACESCGRRGGPSRSSIE
jgi:hypothetical protein